MRKLILQGFTTTTHEMAVKQLFTLPSISRVIVSVAFANEGGVELLDSELKANAKRTTVFIGIRNDITSIQGAKRLLSSGLDLFIVDTGSRTQIFHPKLYLVRSSESARLLIGSANLTLGGLSNNIEASVVLDLDLSNDTELAFVKSIEDSFDALHPRYPLHVVRMSSAAALEKLYESGRLIDETIAAPPRPARSGTTPSKDSVPRIKLEVPFRRRLVARVAKPAKKSAGTSTGGGKSSKKVAGATPPISTGVEFELVWRSTGLTRRDLNIPTGSTTNRTGSVNLDKGQLVSGIDHRHYFRDNVFADLNWTGTSSPSVEETYAKFQLVLKGISYGEFDLRIGHSTDTKSKSYKQNNAMTRLSWGPMRSFVARPDLIDRTLAIYRDKADSHKFVLEID